MEIKPYGFLFFVFLNLKETKIKPMAEIEGSSNQSGISRRRFLAQSSVIGAAAATGLIFPWSSSYASMSDGFPVVETIYGKVRGMNVAGIKTFRGIRYGASTAGVNRFMPPVKPGKWNDVHDAFA
jgi:para-nitrobenzyl esterase